jgi:FAD/FMN-containing dehydrogenase
MAAIEPLIESGDPRWDAARTAWNLAVDQRPGACAVPASADEAAAAVRAAADRGLRIVVQNTGHAAGRIPIDGDALLLRTGGLDGVEVDPAARVARIGGGVQWGAVVAAAAEHGLAPAAGSSPLVGAVGYLTGGGHGWLASRHGLAANDLRAVDVLTADGEVVHLDDEVDGEAMWALRGGGGGWAVVTAAEVGLHPVGGIAGGSLMYPIDRAGEVLEAWREWSADLPEGVTTIGRVLRFPPVEPVPEPLRGGSFAIVEAVDLDGPERLEGLLGGLRELEPAIDTVRPLASTDLGAVHMDPPEPVPALGGGLLLGTLSADGLAAVVAAATEGPGTALIGAEIRRLGGPVARARAEGVACATPAEGALFAVGVAASPELAEATKAGVDAVRSAAAPIAAGHGLANLAAESDPTASIFPPDDLARLTAVADRFDPDGRFARRP